MEGNECYCRIAATAMPRTNIMEPLKKKNLPFCVASVFASALAL